MGGQVIYMLMQPDNSTEPHALFSSQEHVQSYIDDSGEAPYLPPHLHAYVIRTYIVNDADKGHTVMLYYPKKE